MFLTAGEFCQFNIKSRIQILEREGVLLKVRNVTGKYIVKLYKIYRFMVEVIIDQGNLEVINVEPVLNREIIELYYD